MRKTNPANNIGKYLDNSQTEYFNQHNPFITSFEDYKDDDHFRHSMPTNSDSI